MLFEQAQRVILVKKNILGLGAFFDLVHVYRIYPRIGRTLNL